MVDIDKPSDNGQRGLIGCQGKPEDTTHDKGLIEGHNYDIWGEDIAGDDSRWRGGYGEYGDG
jgi:hypothetical protein